MSHRASLLGRGYQDRHLDSPRVRFRRALTLCLMTIVVPGSAQRFEEGHQQRISHQPGEDGGDDQGREQGASFHGLIWYGDWRVKVV